MLNEKQVVEELAEKKFMGCDLAKDFLVEAKTKTNSLGNFILLVMKNQKGNYLATVHKFEWDEEKKLYSKYVGCTFIGAVTDCKEVAISDGEFFFNKSLKGAESYVTKIEGGE